MKKPNVIEILKSGNFTIACNHCGEDFSPSQGKLFDVREPMPKQVDAVFKSKEKTIQKELSRLIRYNESIELKSAVLREKEKKLSHRKFERPKIIKVTTRKVNIGQILEKILPSTKSFNYSMHDCRSMFDPIDYLAFNGLSKSGAIESISFIEVKTGDARLQKNQKQIKTAVQSGHLDIRTY